MEQEPSIISFRDYFEARHVDLERLMTERARAIAQNTDEHHRMLEQRLEHIQAILDRHLDESNKRIGTLEQERANIQGRFATMSLIMGGVAFLASIGVEILLRFIPGK